MRRKKMLCVELIDSRVFVITIRLNGVEMAFFVFIEFLTFPRFAPFCIHILPGNHSPRDRASIQKQALVHLSHCPSGTYNIIRRMQSLRTRLQQWSSFVKDIFTYLNGGVRERGTTRIRLIENVNYVFCVHVPYIILNIYYARGYKWT